MAHGECLGRPVTRRYVLHERSLAMELAAQWWKSFRVAIPQTLADLVEACCRWWRD
jgi:hypothetical protein